MNTPRTLLLACSAALALAPLTASAQDAAPQDPAPAQPADQPSVEQAPAAADIFEAYIEAIGGHEAVRAQTHRKLSGTYRGAPFANGARITLWQQAPDKAHLRLAEPLGASYSIYFNGETAWERDTDGVARELGGSDRVEMMETGDFLGEAGYADRYEEIRVIGEGNVEGDEAWAVYARSTNGRERTLMFSKTSHLFVAEESTIGGENPMRVQVVLDQYKDIGGVLFPMRQRQQLEGTDRKVEIVYRDGSAETFDHDFDPPADVIPAPAETKAQTEAQSEAETETEGDDAPADG